MSQFDDSCQLEISRVYPEDEGEYTCVATNNAGTASCSATLTLDGRPITLERPHARPPSPLPEEKKKSCFIMKANK
ncbi:hypothetical protein INR49_006719 [Caranx melampygus]|nr:hypothetical protein INR49_006719 [Caranx melampygus]